MSYVVAIPSYQRAKALKEKTLATLLAGGVSPKRIHVFVANKEEEAEYAASLSDIKGIKIVVGVKGINAQRRFITNHFPAKKMIVSVDDDVEKMLMLNGKKLEPLEDIHGFFTTAFNDLKKHKLHVWGVYPVANAFYMEGQKPLTTSLKFLIGVVHGYINRHDADLVPDAEVQEKEDVQFSILAYIKDGGVLRYNNIAFKTKFKAAGGLGRFEDRLEANRKAALFLEKKYPQFVRVKVRPNGMHEVVLRDKERPKA